MAARRVNSPDRRMIKISAESHTVLRELAENLDLSLKELTRIVVQDCYQIMRQAICKSLPHDRFEEWFSTVFDRACELAQRPEVLSLAGNSGVASLPRNSKPVVNRRVQVSVTLQTFFEIGIVSSGLGLPTREAGLESILKLYARLLRSIFARGLYDSEAEWMKTNLINLALHDMR